MRARAWLALGAAAVALALPAIAQQTQPGPGEAVPATPGATANSAAPAAAETPAARTGTAETGVEVISGAQLKPLDVVAVEYPGWARRDPRLAGVLDPVALGLGANPWGAASGDFLSLLMRRMDTPLASRWAHIALRNALLARALAPVEAHPVDWTAERAWLLLRMGEADAARMLVAGVDTDRFTPKMVQVAVQSALADGDPPALCPIEGQIRKYEPGVRPLVSAMCSSLAGEPQVASVQIDDARRYGRVGGIDLALAEKVVGAGSNTGRTTTIEWEPVDNLNAWRFGLAIATGLAVPDRLLRAGSPQLRAFHARAALIDPSDRLESAFIAAGLGVFSSQSMVDLFSSVYDSTDASDLPATDAWKLRQAFVAKDDEAKIEAMRYFLKLDGSDLKREGARATVARAASLIKPNADLQDDAPALVSAMLAAGYDVEAARWLAVVDDMDDEPADRLWAMLALAAPDGTDVGSSRLSGFIRRDQSEGKLRSALLVAGLAGLGRLSEDDANSLNRRNGFGLGRKTSWTRIIDAAAERGQAGSVLVLTGTGLQSRDWAHVPASHIYHALGALLRTGQGYTARMIAAEGLSRT